MDDRNAFLLLFLKHELEIKAMIRCLVRDRAVRDDVFQDVALTLWEQFGKYDRTRPFGAWARGVVSNKVLQRQHQDRRFASAFSDATLAAMRAAFDRTEQRSSGMADALEDCVEALPERVRQLLHLRFHSDLKIDQIAAQLNRTALAVYQALSRLRRQLQDCVLRKLGALDGGD